MDLITRTFVAQPQALLWGLGAVLGVLTVAVAIAAALPRLRPGRDFTNLRQRIASGWVAVLALFVVISFIALREFLSLVPARREDRPILLVAYLTIPISYVFVATDDYGMYLVFAPVYVFLLLPFLMACIGQTRGYLA